jgi:WD40-like Beta Propeller Repeat
MSDTKQMLQRARDRFVPPEDVLGSLIRRRERKRRNQRIGAGALAIILALVSFVALTRAFRTAEVPADEPTPKPQGIFSEVGGWIVYGALGENCEPTPCPHEEGIWAVDPTRPDDPSSQIQLSTERGIPLAWSSDGSRLLILRTRNVPHQASQGSNLFSNLFVLNADGTETRLTEGDAWITSGSFSPDGSEVVYAIGDGYGVEPPGIFLVDAAGGTPLLLLPGGDLQAPTFSPDGSKIAYLACCRSFDGNYRLRVMNADGSGSRDLSLDTLNYAGYKLGLVWSPDGTRLAIDLAGHIYTIGADGSDLTLVIPHGGNPQWSPDGSRLAYDFEEISYPPGPELEIADPDGKNAQRFEGARSGPWNPLVQPESEVVEVPTASEAPTLGSILLTSAAILTLVVGFVFIRRRRGAIPAA